jgi:hypothetical protein
MENPTTGLLDDVDAIVAELEVQFGADAILPEEILAGPTLQCTFVPNCNQ